MKKTVLITSFLLATLISFSQTLCDSIVYSIHSSSANGELTLLGDLNSSVTIDYISWDWQVCDAGACYTSDSSVATFLNLLITGPATLKLDVWIIGNGDTCFLHIEDTLLYGTNGWEVTGGDHLTSTLETRLEEYLFDGRIFDLLGREYNTIKSVPFGVMYVRNGKRYIKVK